MLRRMWTWLAITMLVFSMAGAAPAFAQSDQPGSSAPQANAPGIQLLTRFPAQEVAIGESVTLSLKLRTSAEPRVVRLAAQDLPEGWTATFRGDGRVIQAATVDPKEDVAVDLSITPPQDAKAQTYRFTVAALGENSENVAAQLPVELTVKEKVAPSLQFNVELPTLKGKPDTSFSYSATLKNESDEDTTVNLVAEAPQGFQVSFKSSGQDVTSVPLKANESKSVSIEAKAFDRVPAGEYKFPVTAQGDKLRASTTLVAEVSGQAELAVTAPDGRLSGQAYANRENPFKLVVENKGSAPVRNVSMSASPPNGWKVTFAPDRIPEIANGQRVEVTANVQPSEQAVAGDYVVNMSAQPQDGAAKSAEFRITVLTSTLWGVVGIGFIAVALAVVSLAVMRFGRR